MNLVGKKVKVVARHPRYGMGQISLGDVGVVVKQDSANWFGDNIELVIDFPKQDNWNGIMSDIEVVDPGSNREAISIITLDTEY